MDVKLVMLVVTVIVSTFGLLFAAKLVSTNLTFIQALITSLMTSLIAIGLSQDGRINPAGAIAILTITVMTLKFFTKETAWETVKLSVLGSVFTVALSMAAIKLIFPVTIND